VPPNLLPPVVSGCEHGMEAYAGIISEQKMSAEVI